MAYELIYTLINNDIGYEVSGYTGEPVDVVIPKEYNGLPVTSIGNRAFASCSSLTSIEIPNSVTTIVNMAFASCSSLTSIEIPNSVTTIKSSAFISCYSLTSIVIPDSVTTIANMVFYGCNSLTDIILLAKTPATLAGGAFTNISSEAKFYCLSSAIEVYKTATNWNTYANQFVADDMRLYFTMNARAQKEYFASKEWVQAQGYGAAPAVYSPKETTIGSNTFTFDKNIFKHGRVYKFMIKNGFNEYMPDANHDILTNLTDSMDIYVDFTSYHAMGTKYVTADAVDYGEAGDRTTYIIPNCKITVNLNYDAMPSEESAKNVIPYADPTFSIVSGDSKTPIYIDPRNVKLVEVR